MADLRIIRVFPRRTNATPDDDMTIVGRGPSLFDIDRVDEVHVSVTFDWDIELGEKLAEQWGQVAPTRIGGPAMKDFGGEFVPGLYLKQGYLITSCGCPNRCWFCRAWKTEGNQVRELEIKEGWNILDNNLLATSRMHQKAVFAMLSRQVHRPMFTGGFEAARFTEWHVEQLIKLKPQVFTFSYDEELDWEPLVSVAKMLQDAGLAGKGVGHTCRVYVLVGYPHDSFEDAEQRLNQVCALHLMPMAMLYDKGRHLDESDRGKWITFQRQWAHPVLVGRKMAMVNKAEEKGEKSDKSE